MAGGVGEPKFEIGLARFCAAGGARLKLCDDRRSEWGFASLFFEGTNRKGAHELGAWPPYRRKASPDCPALTMPKFHNLWLFVRRRFV